MAAQHTLTFTIAMIVYVITPGPGVMAVVARALADGVKATIPHITGILTGNMIYLLASIYGLSWIALQMGEAFFVIKLLGGAWLIYLGIRLWRASSELAALKKSQPKTILATFFTGLMITASNPKAILFYLALLPAVLDLGPLNTGGHMDWQAFAPVAAINSLVLLVILFGYSILAASIRSLFSSQGALKKLNRSAGSVMIAAGVGIAAS